MTQESLEPPVSVTQAPTFDRWMYRLWKRLVSEGQIAWDQIVLSGANLVDMGTRNHYDLQNLNNATYSHLTATQLTDLTDAGATALHKHDHAAQDNLNSASYTHLTAAQATDLTDAGDSTLHYHATDRALANITGLPTGEEILTVPTTPLTVTGSRSDGTALASLLTHLATLGVITDSSTT